MTDESIKRTKQSWSLSTSASWPAEKRENPLYAINLRNNLKFVTFIALEKIKESGVRIRVTFCVVRRHEVHQFCLYFRGTRVWENDEIQGDMCRKHYNLRLKSACLKWSSKVVSLALLFYFTYKNTLQENVKLVIESWEKCKLLKQRRQDWTLITDAVEIEVLKCNLIKEKDKWWNIVIWIKCLNISVNCECNTN